MQSLMIASRSMPSSQPIWNEDETIGVVFNGEIYNYRELRAELVARGHTFRTNAADQRPANQSVTACTHHDQM